MDIIRILYVNGGIMNRGGIESYMMNYYRNVDRNKVQIDFVVHGFEKGAYDDEIIELGGEIHNIPIKSKDYFGNIKALKDIFISGKYKIVHSHMDAMSMVVLKQAKKCGIPFRIAHSHGTQHLTNNKVKLLINEYARKTIVNYATHFCSCSEMAGQWLFGSDKNITIVNNAIDIEKFKVNIEITNEYKNKLNIKNKFVIGHVGAFHFYKNHDFILEIFSEVLKVKEESVLLLIGKGPLEKEIADKVKRLEITGKVKLLGERSDIAELMQVMDVLLLPSQFEGLPVVIIESQASALKSIISTNITREVKLCELVEFMDIENNPSDWANKILEFKNKNLKNDYSDLLIKNGYYIKNEALKLQNMYLRMYKEGE